MEKESNSSILYIAAMPIGNLSDITLRTLEVLQSADQVLCEDAMKTGLQLKGLNIEVTAPKYKYPWQASPEKLDQWIKDTLFNKTSILVSDAGTPGISDPGSRFVRSARAIGIKIVPLPGPSALACALQVSGYQTHPLLFLGFLAPGKIKRQNALRKYDDFVGIIALYESVHRIESLLYDVIIPLWGADTEVFLGREMTKTHEEYKIIDLNIPLAKQLTAVKGEFTVLINRTGK